MGDRGDEEMVIVDTSGLTDADWVVINKLQRIHATNGAKGLKKAIAKLDPVRYLRITAAFFPNQVLNAIEDHRAESGLTEDDLKALIEQHQPTKH